MLRFSRRHADSTPADSEDATSNVADEDKTSASPASRLRAALHRMGPSTPPQRRTASFSESDSDLNPAFSARKSLKDVFSRAMRDSSDDLGAKNPGNRTNLDSDREERDDSQLSDSSLPLSSQAASLNLLRQRLDLPETSSRFETSHSTVKTSHHQDLKHLLETARANGESDISTDTAKASFSQNVIEDDQATASPPARHSPSISPTTPRRHQDSAGTSGSKNINGNNGKTPRDDDTEQLAAGRTPRPPGGWSTPSSSRTNGYSVDPDTPIGRTPAPPGAWKNTPASERKGILKVRFDENAKDHTDSLAQDSQNSVQEPLSDIDDEPGVARAVRLVDSFGRERRFDEDGQEIELPQPTSLANELASSRRTASVRLVDSMGNELDPSVISPDNTSDFGDADGNDLVARIASKVVGARKTLESIESRETGQRTRRTIKQQAIPHDRILELAMESRAARIERERLLRQSHLVRAREEALSKEAKKLESGPDISTSLVRVIQSAGYSKRLLLTVFLLHIILIWILYKCARAYIRHYFLTSYYDPFFPIVDPTPLQQLPFLRYTFLPSRWGAFTAHHTSKILLSFMSSLDNVNRHLLSLVSKPLMDVVDVRLPS